MLKNGNGHLTLVLLAKTRAAVFDSISKVSGACYKICIML